MPSTTMLLYPTVTQVHVTKTHLELLP